MKEFLYFFKIILYFCNNSFFKETVARPADSAFDIFHTGFDTSFDTGFYTGFYTGIEI